MVPQDGQELSPVTIRIAHAKDLARGSDTSEKHADTGAVEYLTLRGVGAMELHGPGQGALNYPLYLELLAAQHPNMPVIIEHVVYDALTVFGV
jgi:sugar phosphate isomerase/epimerase